LQTQLIRCPNCDQEFELTETLALPLVEAVRSELGAKLQTAQDEAQRAKSDLAKERSEIAVARAGIDAEIAKGIAAKRPELIQSVRTEVKAELEADVLAKDTRIAELLEDLGNARKAELAAEKAKQEFELKVQGVDLEVIRKVNEQLGDLRQQAQKEADESNKQKLAEKDLLIKRLTEQAEELKRKAEQGSQRDQGEAAELELQDVISTAFPWDEVGEIKSGIRGADVLQRVKTGSDTVAGAILWERKKAQGWGGEWLAKAKDDMRREKADLVVIVSEVVPKGIEFFDCCEDVWVVTPSCVVSVAKALRAGLLETANARRTAEGRKTNAERAYDYLMGPEFVARLKGIAEPFVAMQSDLESERRAMTKHWARRQKHIERVLEAAFGMRGDIEGLAGADLPELEAIEIRALTEGEPREEGE
jgi:hypothetical protein